MRCTHRRAMYMGNTTDRLPARRALFQKRRSPAASFHYGYMSRNIAAGHWSPKVSFPRGEGHKSPTRSFQTAHSLSRESPSPAMSHTAVPASGTLRPDTGGSPGRSRGGGAADPRCPPAPSRRRGPVPRGGRAHLGRPAVTRHAARGAQGEPPGAAGSGSAAVRRAVPGGSAGPSERRPPRPGRSWTATCCCWAGPSAGPRAGPRQRPPQVPPGTALGPRALGRGGRAVLWWPRGSPGSCPRNTPLHSGWKSLVPLTCRNFRGGFLLYCDGAM